MKVQYASDLHLEFYDNSVFIARNPFKAVGDVLVLAGDTLPLKEFDSYKQHRFFDWCADNFRQTCLIPGNPWYELKYHGNYLTVTGEDPVVAVDPEGGPYIMAGSLLAGYRVIEIRQIAADDRIILRLKKI